jgi:type I restriction enzyme, S subunit
MKLTFENRQLPSGWKLKKFGEIAILSRGQNPPKSEFIHKPKEGYVRFYQIRDGHNDDHEVYVPDTPQIHKVEPDDILMVAYRHIGRVFRGAKGAFNVALCKISNKNRSVIDDDYLFYIIPTEFVRGELMKQAERSLIPSMSVKHLAEIEIPVPPISEQKRIVAIVDEAFESIDIAIENTKKNLTNARELFESYLNNIFMQENDGWKLIRLGDLSERITKGSSPNWQGINYVDEPGILFVTSENVGENQMLFEKTKYVEEAFNTKDSKSILELGDVLTNIVGASIGRTAIYDRKDLANINQAVCLIRCKSDKLLNKYLSYLLNSPYFRRILHDNEIDNARANLSLGFFRELQIPVPSLMEQQLIVARMNAFGLETKRLETIYQEKLAALTELKQSILQKAFTGELTADSANQTTKKAKEVIAA